MTQITGFATREALMQAVAARIADALNTAIAARGEACAALSGGSTPEPAYQALAAMPLEWPRVTFALVDERFVPPTDDASNEKMLRRALAPALSAGAQFTPMYASGLSHADAAALADRRYAGRRIDIAVMGMGEDGHTASWFHGTPDLRDALDPTNPRTVIAVTAPGATGSPERLTLTRSALMRAKTVLLLITGARKRAKLEAACREGGAPVSALFEPDAPEVLWAP